MKRDIRQRLFWFLRAGAQQDLSNPGVLEAYVQQILTHGQTEDIRRLLKEIPANRLQAVFDKIHGFLPAEVRSFWERFFGNPK